MHISNTKQITTRNIKAIIVGPSGSGKTSLIKTLDHEKTLVINLESGLLSLSGTSIDVVDIGAETDIKKKYQMLTEVSKYLLTDEAKKKYENIVIDSITEVGQLMFNFLRLKYPDRKDNLPLYGELADSLRSFIKFYRDIPNYSIFFTALSSTEKDDLGRRYFAIDLIGKISQQVEALVDLVLYVRIIEDDKGTKRMLQTQKTDQYPAKDRSGKLDQFESMDLQAIKNKILNVELSTK